MHSGENRCCALIRGRLRLNTPRVHFNLPLQVPLAGEPGEPGSAPQSPACQWAVPACVPRGALMAAVRELDAVAFSLEGHAGEEA